MGGGSSYLEICFIFDKHFFVILTGSRGWDAGCVCSSICVISVLDGHLCYVLRSYGNVFTNLSTISNSDSTTRNARNIPNKNN